MAILALLNLEALIMLNPIFRWITRCGMASILLILFGCSSSSNNGYTLFAQLPPETKTQLLMQATIDVEGSSCKVNVMTWSTNPPWRPSCTVNLDQKTHKNFTIDGQAVDLVAVSNGFKVSNSPSLTVPLPAASAAPAAAAKPGSASAAKSKASGKTKKTEEHAAAKGKASTSAPASGTASAAAAATSGNPFPTHWVKTLYPGHRRLVAQNLGYLVKSASIDINGSTCVLNVAFKVRYPAYHLECGVTTDKRGDFTLLFNPFQVAKVASSATNSIQLDSEGESISGSIWDSHGFDAWTPSVPPSWRVRTAADK